MSKNYYEQDVGAYSSIEKITLAEDVKFSKFTNVLGKFYYSVMSPTEDQSKATIRNKGSYSTANYVELVIPTHLLMAFVEPKIQRLKINNIYYNVLTSESTTNVVPKGTIFLAELVGGRLELEKLAVVGLYIPPT